MVRAIVLQTNFSGSYFDPSQGIFATINVAAPTNPVLVRAARAPAGLALNWNSQAGIEYQVQASQDLAGTNWTAIRPSILASGTNCSWSDATTNTVLQRFYRVITP